MIFALLVGVGLVVSAAALAAAFRRMPRHVRCPECGAPTDAVLPPPWLAAARRWIGLRWCASCAWEGVGRRGPARIPGRVVAHDSGFHWGPGETGPDDGFRWEPPRHPAGFRFAPARCGRPALRRRPWRRATFRWGAPGGPARGFRWAPGR